MFTRREALKIGVGTMSLAGTRILPDTVLAQSPGTPPSQPNVLTPPNLDTPIIVKWRYTTGTAPNPSPVWRENRVYGTSRDGFAYALDATTGAEIWRSPILPTWYEPIVTGDLVLVGETEGSVLALDMASGAERWRAGSGGIIRCAVADAAGLVISCNRRGSLIANDVRTGMEVWRFDMMVDYVDPQFLVISVSDAVVFLKSAQTDVIALDPATGAERWRRPGDMPVGATVAQQGDTAYFADSSGLHAVNSATGEVAWDLLMSLQMMSPLSVNNGVIYFSLMEGPVYAVDMATGQINWQAGTQSYGASDLQITDSTIVLIMTIGGQMFPKYEVYGLDRQTGATLWQAWPENYNLLTLRAAVGDTVYVGESHAKMPESEHALHLIDSTTGVPYWTWQDIGGFTSPPNFGEGTAYFGKAVGTVLAIGNLAPMVLAQDVELRGAPTGTGISRGSATAGTDVTMVSGPESDDGELWVEVSAGGVAGWIPMTAIDPTTLPPEGEIEYVYVP